MSINPPLNQKVFNIMDSPYSASNLFQSSTFKDDITCTVCFEIVDDVYCPRDCDCTAVYCKSCLEVVLQLKNRCPVCDQETTGIRQNKFANKMLEQLAREKIARKNKEEELNREKESRKQTEKELKKREDDLKKKEKEKRQIEVGMKMVAEEQKEALGRLEEKQREIKQLQYQKEELEKQSKVSSQHTLQELDRRKKELEKLQNKVKDLNHQLQEKTTQIEIQKKDLISEKKKMESESVMRLKDIEEEKERLLKAESNEKSEAVKQIQLLEQRYKLEQESWKQEKEHFEREQQKLQDYQLEIEQLRHQKQQVEEMQHQQQESWSSYGMSWLKTGVVTGGSLFKTGVSRIANSAGVPSLFARSGPGIRQMTEFTIHNRVGPTRNSKVFKTTYIDAKTNVKDTKAIKRLPSAIESKLELKETRFREAFYLHVLEHPNIVKLESVVRDAYIPQFKPDASDFMVFPWAGSDLRYYLDNPNKPFNLQPQAIIGQLLHAVNHLHSVKIAHRNIKPTSVLIDFEKGAAKVKLCSFRFATSTESAQVYAPGFSRCNSPEIICQSSSPENWMASDIWAVGCIFAALLNKKQEIFSGSDDSSLYDSILNVQECSPTSEELKLFENRFTPNNKPSVSLAQKFGKVLPNSGFTLLTQMFKYNPKNRISAAQASAHPYLKEGSLILKDVRPNYSSEDFGDSKIANWVVWAGGF